MIVVRDWIIVHGTRSGNIPTVSRALWGVIESDPAHFYIPGDTLLTGRLKSLKAGIAETEHETFKLSGQGRKVQIPNWAFGRLAHMTKSDWSKLIQELIESEN